LHKNPKIWTQNEKQLNQFKKMNQNNKKTLRFKVIDGRTSKPHALLVAIYVAHDLQRRVLVES